VNGQPVVSGDPINLPSGAILTLHDDGTYSYDPNGAFETLGNGQSVDDSFTYQISDGEGGFDTAVVTVTVDGVNDAPVATDDEVTTPEDVALTFDPRENDTDIESDPQTITRIEGAPIVAGGPGVPVDGGRVKLNDDGTLTFIPTPDFNGAPEFTYTVADPDGLTSTATIKVTVTPVADRNFDPEGLAPDSGNGDAEPEVDTDLSLDPIVVDTVESFGGIGTNIMSTRTSMISKVVDPAILQARFDDYAERSGFAGNPFAGDGLSGFSLRTDVAGAAAVGGSTAEPQVIVDTLMRDGTLFVEIRNTIDGNLDRSATRYRVTTLDGAPLPRWFEQAENGLLLADVPVHTPALDARITVTREDGSFLEHTVRIQTATGEVQPIHADSRVEQTGDFGTQLNRAQNAEIDRLNRIDRVLRLQSSPQP